MFGPIRGPWPDEDWKGWWGDNPRFHTPVFVLTRFPRPSIVMDGGTTFHFVTEGIETALAGAREAAEGRETNRFVTVEVPGPVSAMRDLVHRVVEEELGLGLLNATSCAVYRRLIAGLLEFGAEPIIPACTETALWLDREEASVPLFDATAIHAGAATECMQDGEP